MIEKDTWVEIEIDVLQRSERAAGIPEETRKTPLKMWTKGSTVSDCERYETTEIKTVTGRILSGRVTEVNPGFTHDFGDFIPEIMYIGKQARDIIKNNQQEGVLSE